MPQPQVDLIICVRIETIRVNNYYAWSAIRWAGSPARVGICIVSAHAETECLVDITNPRMELPMDLLHVVSHLHFRVPTLPELQSLPYQE